MIILTGPTACGKTARAVELAQALGTGEIVSADSRQLYRGMDLGTGKDLGEYGSVPYHLIDILPAGAKCNLYEWLRQAGQAVDDIRARGGRAIVCGGTGLYVEALAGGISLPEVPENPELRARLRGMRLDELTGILASMKSLHNTTDVDTPQRAIRAIEIQHHYMEHPEAARMTQANPSASPYTIIALNIDREERRQRIERRLRQRLDNGMIDEVNQLLAQGVTPEDLIYYGLEYKYLTLHVTGKLSRQEMEAQLLIAIHQFAKRQMTWFRGMERRGYHIHWLEHNDPQFISKALRIINAKA